MTNPKKTTSTSNKNENNVWSNPSLIQRIHHSGDEEDEEDGGLEDRKYELERLKALVPKTKKSLSTSSSLPRRTTLAKPKIVYKPKEQETPVPTVNSPPKYYISEQEQQHFIYFIKAWTSTGILSNTTNHYNSDYSYFNHISSSSSHASSNSSHASNSSDSSFQSDSTLYSRNSHFHHNPF